jgi:hypothetical protein
VVMVMTLIIGIIIITKTRENPQVEILASRR